MLYSIPLLRRFRTAGDNDGPAHVFFNNNYLIERSIDQHPTVFTLPAFSSSTGTYDYYGSAPSSIFVIYTRPSLTIAFTANTDVITADTRFTGILSEIHKIHNGDILDYRANRTDAPWQRVTDAIATPIVSYSSSTSAVTSAYTLSILPDQFVKPTDGYTEEIFEDRAEYFLNVRFVFETTGSTSGGTVAPSGTTGPASAMTATTLTFNTLDPNGVILSSPYTASTTVISNDTRSLITAGSWSGLTTYGLFFTCFTPPSKPIVKFPYIATAITEDTTFTPTFNFTNVEDGDSFVLEVTYDLSDSGFTNTDAYTGVTQYFREKTENSLEQAVDKSNTVDLAGSELTMTIKTRRVNAPIRPNSLFLYRIGNVKTLINIFDVEQRIINYSTHYTGATGSRETVRLYVDSKTTEDVATPVTGQGAVGSGTKPMIPPPRSYGG